jgi:hypothetical protein
MEPVTSAQVAVEAKTSSIETIKYDNLRRR